ncbi:MAG: M14 family zinc carboxypeptidase [Desulfobacterales bacterium]
MKPIAHRVGLCGMLLVCVVFWAGFPPFALGAQPGGGQWWNVTPEAENPSPYYDSILYSEIPAKLREIQQNSNRVDVQVLGRSAGGRSLFLVTVTAPGTSGRFGHYQSLRKTMIRDPEKALEKLDQYKDFKVPFFVNGSIHGNEYPGTDACIRLIEQLAYDDSEAVQDILENVILLFNVVQNPDGRVLGTRSNAAGFDINRDFISQTQPEIAATAAIIAEWNPMVFLDLHGFVSPMLIEPCSPPHNPNYEYDLYIKWALAQAEAMEASVLANTGFSAQIPFRDWNFDAAGYYWDDWPPIYTPMFAMYHGAYGHTLETPARDERGVDAHYWAVWGALEFVVQNKEEMIRDQIEIFRRGFLDLPQAVIPDDILAKAAYPDFETLDLFLKEFPAAYVIPPDGPTQLSPHQPAKLIAFLLHNGVQVERATRAFTLDGAVYPKGTYIVWMDQPKRGLANTILEDGLDVSNLGIENLVFYSPPTAWSHPLLWGVHRAVMLDKQSIKTVSVQKVDQPKGSVEKGTASAYVFLPVSVQAFQAANTLIDRGIEVRRTRDGFENGGQSYGPGAFLVPPDAALASELANRWGLELYSIEETPSSAVLLKKPRIAVYGDEGVRFCLDTLGFAFTVVSTTDLNGGAIAEYDLFLNRSRTWRPLSTDGKAAMQAFFAAGGDYVGLTGTGVQFALDAELIAATVASDSDADAIIELVYTPSDEIASGFREDDFAYVLGANWFTGLPAAAMVTASIASGEFLVSGFWPDWEASGAAGKPVIVHTEQGFQDTVLIGVDSTFRGHPENTFRLVGNAIFSCMESP